MGRNIDARRLALRYDPPAIVIEYARKQSYRVQLYHHEIDLRGLLPASKTTSLADWKVSDIVDIILGIHASVLEHVSAEQLKRLIKKLANPEVDRVPAKSDPDPRDATLAATPLPQADYNRVSDTQLRQVKDKMNVVFEKNIVRPGDEGFQYDKQVTFTPSEEASEWDD